jgi:hypothetical protein
MDCASMLAGRLALVRCSHNRAQGSRGKRASSIHRPNQEISRPQYLDNMKWMWFQKKHKFAVVKKSR